PSCEPGRHGFTRLTRRIRQAHRQRNREVGKGGEVLWRQTGMILPMSESGVRRERRRFPVQAPKREDKMIHRASIAGIVLAALTMNVLGAQAHDEMKYPDWSGQWDRVPNPDLQA